MSDREVHGLRDLVRTCVVIANHPGAVAGDGTQIPGWKSWYTTEYDTDGHVLATRIRNSDGSEWASRSTYDASGRMLKTGWGNNGETSTEAVYSYDSQGRLLKITDSNRPDTPITFQYDEHGRKTSVQISRPEDYRPNLAVAGSPFEAADMAPNLPGGGSATTIYDELDRPTEIQVRDARGELVSRAVRQYDVDGRVSEEHQILDNPETIIPADMRAEILKSSGASVQELREHMAKLMGGQAGPSSIAYIYDAQGRVQQVRRRIFNQEQVIETIYNEHGDKAAEITRSKQIGSDNEQSARLPEYYEARYSYQCDDHGNWTKETVSYRSNPDGTFESSPARKRSLTYY